MFHAIGETGVHLLAAEVEIWFAGMAHRPAADLFRQIEQAGLVGDFRARLGWHKAARRSRWDRGLLITRALTQEATGADRNNLG